jgi:hypothetical protein
MEKRIQNASQYNMDWKKAHKSCQQLFDFFRWDEGEVGGGGGIQRTHGVQGWDVGHPPLFESKHTGREERKWSDLTQII